MPRIRSIKPEIWGSSQIMNVSRDARLLFVGMITQADDAGRGSADARKLRGQIFPGDDDLTLDALSQLLAELERERLVVLYEVDGDLLFALPTWSKHQKIDRPSPARYPARRLGDDSSNPPRTLDEGSSGDQGSGIRDQGPGIKDTDQGGTTSASDDSRSVKQLKHAEPDGFAAFIAAYPECARDEHREDTLSEFRSLLNSGHTAPEIVAGAQRYTAQCDAFGRSDGQYVASPVNWLRKKRFTEPFPLPAAAADHNARELAKFIKGAQP